MYAIVEIAGKQYRVNTKDKLKVPLIKTEPGEKINFDRVLAFQDDKGNLSIGTPMVKDFAVTATVVEHGRDKKVIVFKKKRRKGYRRLKGHRQDYSIIEIDSIGKSTSKTKAAQPKAKAETKKEAAPKKSTKSAGSSTTKSQKTKTTKKPAPAKKSTAAKKTAAKTTSTKSTQKTSEKTVKPKEDKKEA